MCALILRTLTAAILSACLSCDVAYTRPEPSGDCREAGAQCQLEGAPLGVCESRSCETPPCFTCTPQH
jgi:hypothetical protein